ncbi:MAG: hypothetical protein WD824_21630 [Cyclobacteriaceae bacterium]
MDFNSHLKKNLLVLFFLFTASGIHAQQKRIYIANDDHTDYLWSADERTYRKVFLDMLDYYIRKADSTINNKLPSELQSRFNCDGNFWLWTYEQNKTKAEVVKLIDKIKSGHISVPFNALVSCHGGTPAEAVLRGMYYAGSLERRFKLDLDLAVAMEIKHIQWGCPLSGLGLEQNTVGKASAVVLRNSVTVNWQIASTRSIGIRVWTAGRSY